MLREMTLSFIGSGNMAEAMIRGLTGRQLIPPHNIVAAGPRRIRGRELEQRYHVRWTQENQEAAKQADILVLSVKPQVLPQVLVGIKPVLKSDVLVISIVAGVRISTLVSGTGTEQVVRAMPNTPGQVGKGMTVWTATKSVPPARHTQANAVLGALGEEIFVDGEEYLDMATALSGTGPAYVFLFIEAMIDAGVHMGFSRHIAERLVLQTIDGSVAVAREAKRHPAELRNQVTSPGGTAAEALYQLEKGGLRTIVSRAIWAAYQKSKLLGDLGEKESQEQGYS